jgi:hypothetical protein
MVMSWRDQWAEFLADAKGIPIVLEASEIMDSSDADAVQRVERTIRRELPPKFCEFLTRDCGGLDISWYFDDDAEVQLGSERESISRGGFVFNLASIAEENPQCESGFVPCEYDLTYRPQDVLAFASTPNGDQFAVETAGPHTDSIIYLSHDLDSIHRFVVGRDIFSFFENFGRLGFIGPEYWVWEQFTNDRSTPIDCVSLNAGSFFEKLRTGRRSAEVESRSREADESARFIRFKHIIEPEAQRLLERKAIRDYLDLLAGYEDMLSGSAKVRYEYMKRKQSQQ